MTRIFDPENNATVVAKRFTFDGKIYEPGDAFPWRKLAITPDGKPTAIPQFDLRGLWAAELIDFVRHAPSRGKRGDELGG